MRLNNFGSIWTILEVSRDSTKSSENPKISARNLTSSLPQLDLKRGKLSFIFVHFHSFINRRMLEPFFNFSSKSFPR